MQDKAGIAILVADALRIFTLDQLQFADPFALRVLNTPFQYDIRYSRIFSPGQSCHSSQ